MSVLVSKPRSVGVCEHVECQKRSQREEMAGELDARAMRLERTLDGVVEK